ncbi:hypothetical protein Tco_0334931 [Tanacetum coccineum]
MDEIEHAIGKSTNIRVQRCLHCTVDDEKHEESRIEVYEPLSGHINDVGINGDECTFSVRSHVKRGRDTKIPQSSGPPVKVGDEVVHKELGDKMERAATTASSLEAEQDSGSGPRCQDTILGNVDAQTRFETTSKQSNDPPLSKVNTFGSGEDINAVEHQLVLPVQVPAAEESDGFAEIIDFLKASSVHYALIVNPIIYTSCIKHFWATTKVKTVNGVRQLQALIDKKKMSITESSIRSDLYLEDAGGTDCLPIATIFEELAKIGAKSTAWNEFSSTMASLIICLATNQKFNLSKYIFDAMVKHLDGGVKFLMYLRFLQDFSGRITPLFDTMMVQASEEVGEDSDHLTDFNQIPIVDQPSTSSPPKKKLKSKRKQRKEAEVAHDETEHEESVLTPSNDLLPSGDDSMQLKDLMVLCTKLQKRVLDLEKAKSNQAIKISSLKKRVAKLEKRRKFRTTGLQRLKKVGTARRIESSNDSLGAQEDASKQGRSIRDINADAEVTLVNETQERKDEDLMFDTRVLDGDEMFVDATTGEKDEQSTKIDASTAGEAVTIAGVEDSDALICQVSTADVGDEGVTAAKIDELTLTQTLIEIKTAKPKVVITAATTTTTTRPKAIGVVVQDPSEFRNSQEVQPSKSKDKGKVIMIEPEVPLKRKDQVALDEDLARNIQAQLDVEIIEEERLARKQEEEANIDLIEPWGNTQAMMEVDRLLAEKLQTREREELTDKEKGKLFMELMEKRRKHFAVIRAQEKRNRPPTKAQKRSQMSTYLKHMGGYKHKQLKGKSYDEIQKLFDKEMKRVNTFVAMSSEAQESNKKSRESLKRQKLGDDKETNEHEEVEADDTTELKKHLVIKKDDDIAIDVIPLATKPPVIVDYKLLKEGIMGIDREDLQTLWKLVKTKHGDLRPKDEHERVLYGDLNVMFEPNIRSDVWRNLQGYKIQKMNIKFRGGLLGLKRLQGFLLLLRTVSVEFLLSVEVKTAQS